MKRLFTKSFEAIATSIAVGVLCLAVGMHGCGDDSCTEGTQDPNVGCCSDGCGNTATSALPRICEDGRFQCQRGVEVTFCTTIQDGCRARTACTSEVGIGGEEQDPVPELCCKGDCNGTEVARRVCKTGLLYECPSGYKPISSCPNPLSACDGAINKYRQKGSL